MFIIAISYNFDGSYIAKKRDSYEDALQVMQEALNEEIATINKESGYLPSVLAWEENDITLVYAEGYTKEDTERNYAKEDCAYYRIFEVEED